MLAVEKGCGRKRVYGSGSVVKGCIAGFEEKWRLVFLP